MSAQEVEQLIRSLPDTELDRHASPESEVVRTELRRRRQEYRDHPEQFERLDDAALDQMFRDIENENP
ncbi:MAG: hypothetical protein L0Z50_10730 [Verrucomicrobiales bacterium]|nr:hypothetical protein [Verrucomicrobiales bacterium]